MNDIYIGAYWGPRRETIDRCAERVMMCLAGLHDCDEAFDEWYEKGKSRKDALKRRLDFRVKDQVLRILESGRHRRDDRCRSVIDDLGFHIALWNGGPDSRSASISTTCGMYVENPHLRNSVVLNLPEDLGWLSDKDRCMKVLKCIARIWEPEWAGVMSDTSREARCATPGLPFVDWIFYMNRTRIDAGQLPASATLCEVDGKGTVVVVQDRPIDPSKLSDLANVHAVEATFGLSQE